MQTNTAKPKRPAGKATAPDDGLTQSERFMKAARDLECDDDPERFAERVRKLAQSKTAKPGR